MWFLAALVQVGIYVGTAILSALLNRQPRQESAVGEPQFPIADPTAPIPVVFGTTRVGMNVIHKAHVTRGENTIRNGALSFGWSSTHVGYYYYLDLAAVLCHGPVGALHDVIVDKTRFLSRIDYTRSFTGFDIDGIPGYTTYPSVTVTGSLGPLPSLPIYTWNTGAVPVTISAGDLLGGKFDRGGIGAGSADASSTGQMQFYPGCGWVDTNTRLETLAGQALPKYPELCWIALGPDFYLGNSEQLPSLEFVITRPPVVSFLGTGLLGNVTANAGADASAAGVLWEILTNPVWGLGLPETDLDSSSFIALETAMNGGLGEDNGLLIGLSFAVTTQVAAKQLLSDVLRTLDGVLYTDPETGLLCVWLLQAQSDSSYGYGILDEYTLDASVIQSVSWTESAPDAQANEVKVEFVDRSRDYTKNTVTVRNVAAIQALGRVESRTVSFLGVQSAEVAGRLGMRELRTISTTVGSATIECDRTGYRLTPGRFFTLNWDVAGKSSRVMRCVSMRDAPNDKVVIEAVEDVYSSPAPAYQVETTPEPTPLDDNGFVTPYVEPVFELFSDHADETLKIFDPQGRVTAVEFGEGSADTWHVAYELSPPNTPNPNPYVNQVGRSIADIVSRWRVSYTAADGSTAYLIGDFPVVGQTVNPEIPILRWTVSAGTVTVTATWNDAVLWGGVQPGLFMDHSPTAFPTFDPTSDTPVGYTAPQSITFPFPAAGAVEYVAAVRGFDLITDGRQEQSEYAFLTIIGADAAVIDEITGGVGSVTSKEFFVRVTEDDNWLGLATIPTSEVEMGTEFRTQRYLVGAGAVRLNANVKTLTGTPSIRLKYSTDSFGSTASILTWTPAGTGLRSSGITALPSGAQADVGLTIYVGDGADTGVINLYELDAEFFPALVTALRDHSDDFSDDFS